ncbi:SigE family RNA polymerase sigma factor [Micromonospora sp. NPDC049523]|uniref:SigE family RNA polymerase sigma factor n=1 Tax=Micromonospora sp. NPDC049523 TaxID=3155921 RepID=UPI003415A0BC
MDGVTAISQAYTAYYHRLVGQLYGLTGDLPEAQDVVQEAYARALVRPARFLEVREPEVWLRTVAMNVARSRFRRRWVFDRLVRAGRVDGPAESVPGLSPDRIALVNALKKLNRPTREAVVLHHLADLTVAEVAAALGVPVGTVKARLSRGRSTLARHLADEPTVNQRTVTRSDGPAVSRSDGPTVTWSDGPAADPSDETAATRKEYDHA